MKKFFSTILAIAVIAASLPAYAYDRPTYRGRVTELRNLIAQCKARGINTQYEEIDANVIATYLDRIGDTYEGNVSSAITNYQLTELDTLYNNAKANLQGYLNGTKQAPQEVYSYVTGDNYEIDGKSLKAVNGAPYYSLGFGHFGLYPYMKEFKSYQYDNVQALVGLPDAIAADRAIDNWDTSISGGANVTFTALTNSGYSNNTSIHVVNNTAAASNVFGRMFQRIAVKPDTNYVISFYAKGTTQSNNFAYTTDEGMHDQVSVSGLTTTSWKKITAGFKTGENEYFKGFTFMFNGKCDVYIDDINIHRSGDSKNLIRNGGFDGDGHSEFDIIYESNSTLNSLLRTLNEAEKNDMHVEVLLQLQQTMPSVITDNHSGLVASNGRYNVDEAISKEVERAYIEAIMGLISEYSSLTSIILVNEPNYNTARFGTYYNSKFATYLQNKHGSISTLNSRYGTSYSSWPTVPSTSSSSNGFEATARYYDWKNFNDSVFLDWYQRTVAIIQNCIPGIPVSLKTQPDFVRYEYNDSSIGGDIRGEQMGRGANMELVAQYSDFHGNDASTSYEDNGLRQLVLKWYDYLDSISDKPIYNSENHITQSGGELGGPTEWSNKVNAFVKNDILQSAMHGLDMSSIWSWSETTNSSSAQYGHLAMRPSAIAGVAKANLDLNRNASKVAAIANAQPDVAILRSDASRIYNPYYMSALNIAYLAALESGHKVGFVTVNNIASKLSSYSTLIIPYATNVEPSVVNAINSFGGTIIMIGTDSLAKNEYNKSPSSDISSKVSNIANRATKYSVSKGSNNDISAPAKATLASALKSGRTVTLTTDGDGATDNVDWQYVTYGNGYLVNISNEDKSSSKSLKVKINGSQAAHVTSLFNGTQTAGTLTLPAMTGGLYYVSNADSTVEPDNWDEVVRLRLADTNDITVLNATRSGNVNTLTWSAQSYGKYNIYEVKADGSLEFIESTYDETFEDTSSGAKTYAVKAVTSDGESVG
ncbi:MAG: beta-galactosidase, partial [Clostridia bacterium]|nr:beta-galactosidase [Clostridia bacterium]